MTTPGDARTAANRRLVKWLAGLVVGMFAFGFALIPLYDLACKAVGINQVGTSVKTVETVPSVVVQNRSVTVAFDANVSQGLPWEFRPMQKEVTVKPGERTLVKFYVHNTSNEVIVGQAIPSITPWQATPYMKKMECFCFNRQELKPGEEQEMALIFMVSPDMPEDLGAMVLSYTFMNTDKSSAEKYAALGASVPSM